MSLAPTMPGTETKVTPEMEAPTMPNATMYQGERRLARKNVSLLEPRVVSRLKASNSPK